MQEKNYVYVLHRGVTPALRIILNKYYNKSGETG